jgi:hypothetical protein
MAYQVLTKKLYAVFKLPQWQWNVTCYQKTKKVYAMQTLIKKLKSKNDCITVS